MRTSEAYLGRPEIVAKRNKIVVWYIHSDSLCHLASPFPLYLVDIFIWPNGLDAKFSMKSDCCSCSDLYLANLCYFFNFDSFLAGVGGSFLLESVFWHSIVMSLKTGSLLPFPKNSSKADFSFLLLAFSLRWASSVSLAVYSFDIASSVFARSFSE